MKKVLVTGGAGYVGSILLRELMQAGYEVVCVDTLMFGGDSLIDIWHHPQFTFHKVDVTDFEALDPILDSNDFFAYVHLAAIVGDPACKRQPELAQKTNWEASVHLLEKARENKVERFVFASTCSNYGKMADPGGMVKEDSPLAPVSLYAELKVKFEKLMLEESEKSPDFCPTSLRFATVYGLSHRMRFDLTVNEFTKELAMGKTLVVFGEQFWRPYCHVSDFSQAIMTVLEAERDKVAYNVFNVGDTAENYTKQMIVDEILKQIPDGKIEYVVKKEDPRDYRVDFTRIREELGFAITKTVPEGIAEVRDIVSLGVVQDPEEQRYYNIPHGE
ncbi:NAD-dependent epimerase/dehydratase family protein [Salidesulfovibrio brasiliensis]|uniref:NAD-dependent epimerase/dehydratase family protein n=1 Tax=Salidesulfovibrio brasiliensis TaxID=221711 RepID=UPI0006D25826|nr:NAD(P)-dependent oxidoreductase [Salidesulfovibrio brasiliensis]